LRRLADLQYQRNDYEFTRGCFRARGDVVDVFPIEAKEEIIRVQFYKEQIEKLSTINYLTGEPTCLAVVRSDSEGRRRVANRVSCSVYRESQKTNNKSQITNNQQQIIIFPAKHFVTTQEKTLNAIENIKSELAERLLVLRDNGKLLEAERLEQRTNYDLEMLQETGYCNGVENYSRYLTNREPGEPPATLLEYFSDDFLLFIDESHMTVPQLNGMYNGDRSRKQTLVDFGFRLPSALDNRPLKFSEFEKNINQAIYVSATPGAKEYKDSGVKIVKKSVNSVLKDEVDKKDLLLKLQTPDSAVTEQIIRPTGLLEPEIIVKKIKGQLADLAEEIQKRVARGERILVGTLTKRLAEEVADYLADFKTTPKIKVNYLHSEILTLERSDILRDLRLGNFDVLVGINLLREGLDLPEVSLVAILDADKEGFLRSETALIQLMGRAARHVNGSVILYADNLTGSMKRAIEEIDRRRNIQIAYNKKFKQKPIGISKVVGKGLGSGESKEFKLGGKDILRLDDLGRSELKELKADFERQMKRAVKDWNFEEAARLRDQLKLLNRKSK